jgi:hypothetical protein
MKDVSAVLALCSVRSVQLLSLLFSLSLAFLSLSLSLSLSRWTDLLEKVTFRIVARLELIVF